MARRLIAFSFAFAGFAGCAGSAEDGGDATDDGGASTSTASTGAPTTGSDPTTSTSTSTTGDGTSTGMAESTGVADSSGGSDSSGGCPPGTEGCPCDAAACGAGLRCVDDTCEAVTCRADDNEPNEDEASATDLGQISDLDIDGGTVVGSLHSEDDVDWYVYLGDDDPVSNVDPARSIQASGGVRLCKFFECEAGLAQTDFECPLGSDYALANARPGCCSVAGDVALPDLDCEGVAEDNATVYIRVDQPDAVCVTYELDYHY